MFDVIIIGGGPAAAAAAVYTGRKRLNTLLITEEFGGQSVVSDNIEIETMINRSESANEIRMFRIYKRRIRIIRMSFVSFGSAWYHACFKKKEINHQRTRRSWNRHWFGGSSGRAHLREDWRAHGSFEKKSQRQPFAPRTSENGWQASAFFELSGEKQQQDLQGND